MTRILVLGGSGMLGHKMFQVLGSLFPETSCTVRSSVDDGPLSNVGLLHREGVIDKFDVTDSDRMRSLLTELEPEVVVNCVGVIKQRRAAVDPILSITVNSLLPHRLAEMSAAAGARLIHFSTDCVFSGSTGGYAEDDPSDAGDLYGRTKYLGEVAEAPAITLRTSIIGRELMHHASLLEWVLSQQGKTVQGYRRALFSGITTNRMALLVAELIGKHPGLSGLFHVAGPWISKYELLNLIRDAFDLDISIEPEDEVVIDRTLVADRFAAVTGLVQPSWVEMVRELANDPTPYESWRR